MHFTDQGMHKFFFQTYGFAA